MEMITGVERRLDVRRMVWVPRRGIEINFAVEGTTGANPLVDSLTFLLLIGVVVPLKRRAPLPFDGIEFEPRQSMKYRSNFNVIKLIKLANKELKFSDTAAYMIFLLGVAAGLRRKEIDLLEWPSFRFKDNVVRIEPTQFFHPKSQDSIAEIQVDPEIMKIFREYHAKAKGAFVIPAERAPKTVSRGDYYRCEPHFDRLNTWLRTKGVNAQKPLHTLRKEYGSLINKAHGIHAASKALEHFN
jgi:hypothetical protein